MIKVKNIMTKEVITISQNSSIKDAAGLMTSKSVSGLVVVDKNKPIGVVSENDIIKGVVSKKKNIKDIISKEFITISPTTRFNDIVKSLKDKSVRKFPVVENNKLVGLITETDIIEATRDFTRIHQIVQEAILAIFGLATAFFLFYLSPLRASIFG